MKRIISGLILFGMIMAAHPSQAAFGGLRVGGMAGIGLLQGRHFYAGTPSPERDMIKRLSIIGSMLGAHAGYLFELSDSKIAIGGEVYLLIPGISPTIDLHLLNGQPEGTASIKHNRSVGFAVTAGMMMNPKILVYVNVGIENARFQFTYNLKRPPANAAMPPKQVFNHSFKAFTPALGATYKMSPHLLFGLELSSPFFKRFKMRQTLPRTFHYKPAERRLVLKISYLF